MNFPRLFEPIEIGPKTARNRVMRLATVTDLCEGEKVGERMFAHYQEVAQGGVVVTEALRVHPSDVGRPSAVSVFDPAVVPSLRRLAGAVHAADALLIAQLNHGGRQHLGRQVPTLWAPSAIPCPYSGGVPHEITRPEVRDVIEGYYWAAAFTETVATQGKTVTLVTRFFEVLRELPAVSRIATLRALDEQGVRLRPRAHVDRIEKGTVVLRDYYSGREERIVDAAAVIWVGPQEAQGALAEALRAAGIADVRVVGDAFAPRRLANAIEDGHRAGRAV